MSDRIEEIRKRWSAATPGPWDVTTNSGRGEEKWRTIRAKGWAVVRVDEFTRYTRGEPETFCGVWIEDANAQAIGAAPSDIAFLLAEVERQAAQLARIKAVFLHAGCSDYTDDVARMAEEFLAQGEEG